MKRNSLAMHSALFTFFDVKGKALLQIFFYKFRKQSVIIILLFLIIIA